MRSLPITCLPEFVKFHCKTVPSLLELKKPIHSSTLKKLSRNSPQFPFLFSSFLFPSSEEHYMTLDQSALSSTACSTGRASLRLKFRLLCGFE